MLRIFMVYAWYYQYKKLVICCKCSTPRHFWKFEVEWKRSHHTVNIIITHLFFCINYYLLSASCWTCQIKRNGYNPTGNGKDSWLKRRSLQTELITIVITSSTYLCAFITAMYFYGIHMHEKVPTTTLRTSFFFIFCLRHLRKLEKEREKKFHQGSCYKAWK